MPIFFLLLLLSSVSSFGCSKLDAVYSDISQPNFRHSSCTFKLNNSKSNMCVSSFSSSVLVECFFSSLFFCWAHCAHTHTHIDSRRRRSNSSGNICLMHKCASAIRKQLNKYLRFLRALFDCFFLVVFGLFFPLSLSLSSFFLPFHLVLQCSEFGNIY